MLQKYLREQKMRISHLNLGWEIRFELVSIGIYCFTCRIGRALLQSGGKAAFFVEEYSHWKKRI